MRRARIVVIAGMLAVALVAGACAKKSSDTGGGTDTSKPLFTIGFLGALTGDNAQLVIHGRNASKMAIDAANKKGDLPVRLQLDAEDSQGDKDKVVPLAQKLAGDDKVLAVVGPAFSGESFSAGPILEEAHLPRVTPSATNPGLAQQKWTHWFRAVGNDNSQGGPAPDILTKYLKVKKVYIAHDKSAYGEGLATIVRDKLKATNASALVAFDAVDPGAKDYSTLASKIVSSGADAMFWGGYSPEAALIVKQTRDKGWKGTFLGADGSKDETFLKNAGTASEDAVFMCPCADVGSSTDAATKTFVSDYKAAFKTEPGIYAGEGYDATNLIIDAIRASGKPGADIKTYRDTLAKAIGAVTATKGITKSYAFQPDGELVASSVTIYVYKVTGAKFVLLGKADDLLKV